MASIHELPYDQLVLDSEPSIGTLLDGSDMAQASMHIAEHLMAYGSATDLAVTR